MPIGDADSAMVWWCRELLRKVRDGYGERVYRDVLVVESRLWRESNMTACKQDHDDSDEEEWMGELLTYTNVIQQRASVWAMCRRERSLFVVVDNLGRLPFLRESGGRSVGRHARTGPRRGIRLTSASAWRSERWKKVVDLESLLLDDH